MTKAEFDKAMEEGWKLIEYARGDFWFSKYIPPKPGHEYDLASDRETKTRVIEECKYGCAIGAAAYFLKRNPSDVMEDLECLGRGLADEIVELSDSALRKEIAIEKIQALNWNRFYNDDDDVSDRDEERDEDEDEDFEEEDDAKS